MKVAVYGSLLTGLYNHGRLADSTLLGKYQSEPIFTLIDLGPYPGLLEGGITSVSMEVYEIDEKTLKSLDALESYDENNEELSFYIRKTFDTPYGEAFYYVLNEEYSQIKRKSQKKVSTGDWKEHSLKLQRY